MLLPVVYYLVAFFINVLLYEYYRSIVQKQKALADILGGVDSLVFNSLSTSNKK